MKKQYNNKHQQYTQPKIQSKQKKRKTLKNKDKKIKEKQINKIKVIIAFTF